MPNGGTKNLAVKVTDIEKGHLIGWTLKAEQDFDSQ